MSPTAIKLAKQAENANPPGSLYVDRYTTYLACADDGHGIDTCSGEPLKTFDEWMES